MLFKSVLTLIAAALVSAATLEPGLRRVDVCPVDHPEAPCTVVGDVVIVGGGTGGLTVAHQLATHTTLDVHVLEAGDDPTSLDPDVDVPLKAFNVSIKYDWGLVTTPQADAANATVHLPRFKGLGGCSQHNGEGFWLGSRYTYDKWPTGFNYDDFKMAVRQMEGCVSFGPPNHGTTGNLHTQLNNLDQVDPYLMAWKAAALQAGYRFNPDENAPLAKGYMPHVVSIKDGRRFGPYHVFKSVLGKLPNLHVHLNTTVTKLRFGKMDSDGKLSITGVEADQVSPNGSRDRVTFQARKAVVMTAGAYQTPHIMMVSGIGDEAVLRNAGVGVRLHLPGVGNNLKEHYAVPYIFRSKRTAPINDPSFFADQGALYAANRTGYFGYPVGEHSVVTASTRGNKMNPAIPVDVVFATFVYNFFPELDANQTSNLVALLNPRSSGTVTISSGSIYDPPVINPRFFSDPDDFARIQQGLDMLREMVNQTALSEWFGSEEVPGDADDLTVKSLVLSTNHPMGTCMMGSRREEFAVVDNDAAVFGTSGLYIADASVIPTVGGGMPNASPHATIILTAKLIANKLMCNFANVCL